MKSHEIRIGMKLWYLVNPSTPRVQVQITAVKQDKLSVQVTGRVVQDDATISKPSYYLSESTYLNDEEYGEFRSRYINK